MYEQESGIAEERSRYYPDVGPDVFPGSTSSIRRVNENTLEMTCKINGNVFYTKTIELSSDYNIMTITRLIVDESEPNMKVFERQ